MDCKRQTSDLVAWTIDAGLREVEIEPVIAGIVERLTAIAPGIGRVLVGLPTLHPTIVSATWIWDRRRGLHAERQDVQNWTTDDWLKSPIRFALENNIATMRSDLTDPVVAARFPIFQTFATAGYTDYLLHLVEFEGKIRASGIQGVIVTLVCDSPGGFSAADMAAIDSVLPAFSLSAFRLTVSEVARNLLSAYLGSDAGNRVLGGKVMRGDLERIRAAIFLADLRNFTEISERMPLDLVIPWLNAGLAAIGDPATRQGGQILKFLGDGLLAIFPIDGGDDRDACRRALAAACEAQRQVAALESDCADHVVDIALHVGEVGYGNIGASDRLDFTIIGPAVNEASRMEALCDALDVHLVMSERFASHIEAPTRDLGLHRLRGIAEPRRVLTLTEC